MDFAQRLAEERIKKAMNNGLLKDYLALGNLCQKMTLLMYQKNLEWATAS